MSSYEPKPLELSQVELPPEIVALTEKLAENAHDIWALGRIKDGWRYGAQRSDALKTNPCLVPYEELPESEKEYDRSTAMMTLRAIYALGFQISPKTE